MFSPYGALLARLAIAAAAGAISLTSLSAAPVVVGLALTYAAAVVCISLTSNYLRLPDTARGTLLAAADFVALTHLLSQMGGSGVALSGVYPLVLLALGFRHGITALILGAVMAAGSLVYLALAVPPWLDQPVLSVLTFATVVLTTLVMGYNLTVRGEGRGRAQHQHPASLPTQVPPSPQPEMAVKGLRILVGEDDPTYQKLLLRMLEHNAHRADLVHNGEQVLDAIESTEYDLLILDMQMPRMGGIEAAKLFRFLRPDRRRVPVVILTANETHDATQECAEAGVNAFLTKPVQPQQLLRIVSQLAMSQSENAADGAARPIPLQIVHRSPMPDGELLDYDLLHEVAELSNDPQFLEDLFDGFTHDARLVILRLRQAAQLNDFNALVDDGHALMGSARSLGATALAQICHKLIDMAEHTSGEGVEQAIDMLKATFDDTKDALEDFLNEQVQIKHVG